MLDVFLTCDTEVWCGGWEDLDARFPNSFQRYVFGCDPGGQGYGLPFQLQSLADHDLRAVYFVEPLFAGRFGLAPLRDIVALVQNAGQEVQLHLHTEWADEWPVPPLPGVQGKRQYLRQFDVDEQAVLIAHGARLLVEAGAPQPTAFRAGGYGFDHRTLAALQRCGIPVDSSYNATTMGPSSGVATGTVLTDAVELADVVEVPVSVFHDGLGRLRHAQLGACSYAELEQALWAAEKAGLAGFVIVFHNFELMNPMRSGADRWVVQRFERLCRFLADHRDTFRTRGFREPVRTSPTPAGPGLRIAFPATARRLAEQAMRRVVR